MLTLRDLSYGDEFRFEFDGPVGGRGPDRLALGHCIVYTRAAGDSRPFHRSAPVVRLAPSDRKDQRPYLLGDATYVNTRCHKCGCTIEPAAPCKYCAQMIPACS